MRTNRSVRFGFGGSTVLVAYRGHSVSFYTTGGVAGVSAKVSFNTTHQIIQIPQKSLFKSINMRYRIKD